MSEERFVKIEKQLKENKLQHDYIIKQLNELQIAYERLERDHYNKQVATHTEVPNSKIEYLTAANEQMFKQNQRLRQYIEDCLEGKVHLSDKGYLKALSGEQ